MEHTKRQNVNRGYMKLEVWNEAIQLFKFIDDSIARINRIDLRLRSQILDCAQSVSANIAEGYSRRTINEYLQFLNIALGSASELMTRMIGLRITETIGTDSFEEFDKLHYSVENKLIKLAKALQSKRRTGAWEDEFRELREVYKS